MTCNCSRENHRSVFDLWHEEPSDEPRENCGRLHDWQCPDCLGRGVTEETVPGVWMPVEQECWQCRGTGLREGA